MGEYDSNRVEPRTILVGMGMSNTPERIRDIADLQKAADKASRPAPSKAFSKMLARDAVVPSLSAKERRQQALPRRGPRPGLAHPCQRDSCGRGDAGNEDVVLKG